AKKLLDALEDAARKIEEKARTDAEAATAWAKIKDTSDRAELRNFIDRYPASPLVLNDAKKRLIVLEREAMESEKKARAEADAAAAWDKIKDTTDPAELRKFIKSYPNSHLASQDAKERLAAIEDKQKKCSSGEVLRGHTCVEA